MNKADKIKAMIREAYEYWLESEDSANAVGVLETLLEDIEDLEENE